MFSIRTLASSLVFGGVILCSVYKSEPQIIVLASSVAFIGLILSIGIQLYRAHMLSQLNKLESKERTLLYDIRRSVRNGETVTSTMLAESQIATTEVEIEYLRIHGIHRPDIADKLLTHEPNQPVL